MKTITKKCEKCNTSFETNNKYKRFCSKSCASISNFDIPGKRKKKLKQCECCKKEFLGYDCNKFCSQSCANKVITTARWKDEQYRNDMSKMTKNCWKSDEYVKRQAEIKENRWRNPESHNNMSFKISEYNKLPGVKENKSYKMTQKWEDPEYAIKIGIANKKYKIFSFPSGKIVKVQGYEPIVLTELLCYYSENDIFVQGEISKELKSVIKYKLNNTNKTYIPDIYIKSENKIIEVKSEWTFNLHKEKNLAKQKACLEQGFNFEFRIPNNKLLEKTLNTKTNF